MSERIVGNEEAFLKGYITGVSECRRKVDDAKRILPALLPTFDQDNTRCADAIIAFIEGALISLLTVRSNGD